jgi:hypothetical protein
MTAENKDPRFYNATADRCYRNLILPVTVKHFDNFEQYRKNLKGLRETMIERQYWNSDFSAWLDLLGVEIELSRLFTNPPNYQYTKHVDRMRFGDQSAVLNFAFEDAGTVFSWYNLKTDEKPQARLNTNKIPVYFFGHCECEEILKKEILHEVNQPFLINTGYIHSLKVSNTNRYCFSYFLKKKFQKLPLQWDEALEIFSPYLQPFNKELY